MKIDETLRNAIRETGKSAQRLATEAGISQPQLSRFLRGDRSLVLPAVVKLCEALGLELRPVELRDAGRKARPKRKAARTR